MLDSCSSEYDGSLRGTVSKLPHPWAMDMISSVPICRRTVKRRKGGTSKAGSVHENTPSKALCVGLLVAPRE